MFTMLICWCGIRVLCDDRTPDHSGIPDDLIGLPADMELKLDHFIVFLLRMDWEKQI